MRDAALLSEYSSLLHKLVRKSFLSPDSIALVLEDMLRSDLVILWQLIGLPTQSEPFARKFDAFMAKVQARALAEPKVRHAVRSSIVAQLQLIDGYVVGAK